MINTASNEVYLELDNRPIISVKNVINTQDDVDFDRPGLHVRKWWW